MPTFEYKCEACGFESVEQQSFLDDDFCSCPRCASDLYRNIKRNRHYEPRKLGQPGYLGSIEHREHLRRIDRAHHNANRKALLEHARMGRSVPQCRRDNDEIVRVTPAEIFAIYGFDEFGRPLPGTTQD